ncbi:helix-turn-helix transcriptional regulator [Ferrovibrio terrae]|uniref:helix-turn-helix domain-containing protein n=1 Tax=Ferrovibrio terrae TaxID=2594003 RepID=UPI00313810DC
MDIESRATHFLRHWRTAKKLSQAALAELAGTVQQHIAKLENGERDLVPQQARRLASALGINMRQLYFGPDEPNDEEFALIQKLRMLPESRRRAVLEVVGGMDLSLPVSPQAAIPAALAQAADEMGKPIANFDRARWEELQRFTSNELAQIREIQQPSDQRLDEIVATVYLLDMKNAEMGHRPDFSQLQLFVRGQAKSLRAERRRRPQA